MKIFKIIRFKIFYIIFVNFICKYILSQGINEIKFYEYLKKFKELDTLYVMDSQISENEYNKLNLEEDSIFLPRIVPAVAIGKIKIKNQYIVIVGYASSVYVPTLIVYNENGKILDYAEISEPCGAGCYYFCKEYIFLFKNTIYSIKLEKDIDFQQKRLTRFLVNDKGKIKKKVIKL